MRVVPTRLNSLEPFTHFCAKKGHRKVSFLGAEDYITRVARSVATPTCLAFSSILPIRSRLARTRGNSLEPITHFLRQKKDTYRCPFLAQKTRFELVLRSSHTTPLAGEPLEPLGYFCIHACGSFKRYNTITHFLRLVKRFLGRKYEKYVFFLFL